MSLTPKSSFLELYWSDPEEKMDRDMFKKDMLAYREAVEEHKVRYVLNDSLKSSFVMTPEIQEWIAKEIYPYTGRYLQKIAFVMPWDLIQKLAMSQMIDEYEEKDSEITLKSRYFKSVEEAKQWLFGVV